jgi:hypothetical protein
LTGRHFQAGNISRLFFYSSNPRVGHFFFYSLYFTSKKKSMFSILRRTATEVAESSLKGVIHKPTFMIYLLIFIPL